MFSSCSCRIVPSGGKEPAERARHDQTSHGEQHHRAVRSCGDRIEFLVDVAKASEQKAEAQGEQQIGQDRADQRSPHHVRIARLQRHERDNQLRRVAERRIEQATNSFSCACGDLFRSQHDEPGDGDYGDTSAKKNPRVRLRRDVLKRHSDRHKDEKPIDRHLSLRECAHRAVVVSNYVISSGALLLRSRE